MMKIPASRFAVLAGLLACLALTCLSGCGTFQDFLAMFEKETPKDEEVTWSQGAPPLERNLALVLDTSGSMISNDETGMMLFSSLVFLDMLGEQDQVYVTSFPGKDVIPSDRAATAEVNALCRDWIASGRDEIGPMRNSADGNGRIKDWVRGLPYSSQVTVFQEPLQRAVAALAGMQSGDAKRYVILFTDGNTDRGGDRAPGAMAAVHEQERLALLAYRNELVRRKIVFYGVVLGQATRDDHLRPLAEATGGAVLRADNPADLVSRFAEVFGRILETKVEPITLNGSTQQRINRYVKEFILFIPTDGNTASMAFNEPDGRKLSGNIGGADGYLRRDAVRNIDPYQIVHVKNPKPGDWEYKLSGVAQAPALLIQNYDVYLQINGTYPRRGLMNMPNQIRGRLVDSRGEPIQDPEFFAEGAFQYGADYESQHEQAPGDETYAFAFEITPRDTLFHDLTCKATNGTWLTRTITVPFAGKDGVVLRVNNDADFGSIVPYADGMYFWWCRWVSKLLGLPDSKDWRANKARVRFVGTDEALKGTVFELDETGLREKHNIRLVDSKHRARFVIGEDYAATFKLDVDRSARRLNERVEVPIIYPPDAGRIRGDKAIGVKAAISPLNWAWRTSHFWLQWLIYIWLFLFFVVRPLVYVIDYSTWNVNPTVTKAGRRMRGEGLPDPKENALSAYIKALIAFPTGLVVSNAIVRKGGAHLSHVDTSAKASLLRAMAHAVGMPFGSYLRHFTVSVPPKRQRISFYKRGRDISLTRSAFENIAQTTADRKQTKELLKRTSIELRVDEDEDGLKLSFR